MPKLANGDFVVTAFAESDAGPGWGNQPVRVIVQNRNGDLRQEWLQPDEQSVEMQTLYAVSQAAHLAMVRAVNGALKPRNKRKPENA